MRAKKKVMTGETGEEKTGEERRRYRYRQDNDQDKDSRI